MEPSIKLLAILNLLGAAQGMFLGLALLGVKRDNEVAKRLLAALVFTIAVNVAGAVVRTTHYDFTFPHLSRVHDPFPFLTIPLLFLYVRALTSRKPSFPKRDFLHFVPFVVCVVYLIPYYLQSREGKLSSLLAESSAPSLGSWYYARSAILLFMGAVYLVFTVSVILAFVRSGKERTSPTGKAVLFQIRFLVVGFLLLFVGGVVRYVFDHTAKRNLLLPLGASILVYAIGYLSFRNPEVLARETDEAAPAKKYERSTLTPETAERYLKRLLQVMEAEKPYLDPELTVSKLAEKLSVPAPHLSQIINERLSQTFVDFINTHRVEEAKRRLLDPSRRHYSVLAIAEEVGFNSKSSFNSVFKKHARMTPSEFRKSSNGKS
jgi:AraC-like DNA-binding protein